MARGLSPSSPLTSSHQPTCIRMVVEKVGVSLLLIGRKCVGQAYVVFITNQQTPWSRLYCISDFIVRLICIFIIFRVILWFPRLYRIWFSDPVKFSFSLRTEGRVFCWRVRQTIQFFYHGWPFFLLSSRGDVFKLTVDSVFIYMYQQDGRHICHISKHSLWG